MEKTLRVLGAEHDHAHAHETEGASTAVHTPDAAGLRQRKKADGAAKPEHAHHDGPSKLSAYLNLFGDFVHNMCAQAVLNGAKMG